MIGGPAKEIAHLPWKTRLKPLIIQTVWGNGGFLSVNRNPWGLLNLIPTRAAILRLVPVNEEF